MYQIAGIDPNGHKRVFGYGATHVEAKQQCQTAVLSYIVGRPDTAPYDKWKFVEVAQDAKTGEMYEVHNKWKRQVTDW